MLASPDSSMDIDKDSVFSQYNTATSVGSIISENSSTSAESDFSNSPTYVGYPDVIPQLAPFSLGSETAPVENGNDLDARMVFVGNNTYTITPPRIDDTVILIENSRCPYVIDTSSVSGYLGSKQSSFASEKSEYKYLTNAFQDALDSIPNFAAGENDNGCIQKAACVEGNSRCCSLHAAEAVVNNGKYIREQYKLIEQYFIALCESVCLFILLQTIMVLVKKFDPQLTNIFSSFAYNLSYFACISVVVLMSAGTYVKIIGFVTKWYSSKSVRFGIFVVTTALVVTMFSTFCVIEHFFNSQWLKSL